MRNSLETPPSSSNSINSDHNAYMPPQMNLPAKRRHSACVEISGGILPIATNVSPEGSPLQCFSSAPISSLREDLILSSITEIDYEQPYSLNPTSTINHHRRRTSIIDEINEHCKNQESLRRANMIEGISDAHGSRRSSEMRASSVSPAHMLVNNANEASGINLRRSSIFDLPHHPLQLHSQQPILPIGTSLLNARRSSMMLDSTTDFRINDANSLNAHHQQVFHGSPLSSSVSPAQSPIPRHFVPSPTFDSPTTSSPFPGSPSLQNQIMSRISNSSEELKYQGKYQQRRSSLQLSHHPSSSSQQYQQHPLAQEHTLSSIDIPPCPLSTTRETSPTPPASPVISPVVIEPKAKKAKISKPRKVSSNSATSSTSSKDFRCSICDRSFARKYNMIQHFNTHDGTRVKNEKCEICGTKFFRVADLNRHYRTHSGKGSYVSPCGRSFSRSDAIERHRKKTSCVICNAIMEKQGVDKLMGTYVEDGDQSQENSV